MGNKLRIKEILRERGITVTEFADKLGIERQNVYNIFNKPTWQRLEQCSEILNLPISELFEEESSDVNGYLEYKGIIYKVSNKISLYNVVEIIKNS